MGDSVYAVANRKGGVGKTTTAVNLAAGLAEKVAAGGGRVLIIDLDPQGNVSASLDIQPREMDVADLLLGRCDFKDCVISASQANGGLTRPNLYVLPSSDSLAQAKGELMIRAAVGGRQAGQIEDVLVDRLGFVRDLFDYVIIDCPPTLDSFSDAVYQLADAVVVPVKLDYLGEVGTARHTKDILDAQAYGIDIKICCIVPTFYDSRLTIGRTVLAALKRHYGERTVTVPIPRSTIFEQAPAVGGQTIFEYRPESGSAEAYQKLVDRIYLS